MPAPTESGLRHHHRQPGLPAWHQQSPSARRRVVEPAGRQGGDFATTRRGGHGRADWLRAFRRQPPEQVRLLDSLLIAESDRSQLPRRKTETWRLEDLAGRSCLSAERPNRNGGDRIQRKNTGCQAKQRRCQLQACLPLQDLLEAPTGQEQEAHVVGGIGQRGLASSSTRPQVTALGDLLSSSTPTAS